jgi:hypothetical protein
MTHFTYNVFDIKFKRDKYTISGKNYFLYRFMKKNAKTNQKKTKSYNIDQQAKEKFINDFK